MDSTGLSYNSGRRLPSNTRDARASQAVTDWATKKKEQIEKAKQLREERKYGSSHLKNAGENSISSGSNQPSNIRSSNRGYTPTGGINLGAHLGQSNEQPTNFGYPEFLNDDRPLHYGKGNNEFPSGFDHSLTPNHTNRMLQNSTTGTSHGTGLLDHSNMLGLGSKHNSYHLGPEPSQYGASGYSAGLGGMSTQDEMKHAGGYAF